MTDKKLHYPEFNVMDGEPHWDPHTREIVDQRLQTPSFYPFQVLTQQQSITLFELCAQLLDDDREAVISYVVHYFDLTLKSNIGESQRKSSVPPQSVLIRDGLDLLDRACLQQYGRAMDRLPNDVKQKIAGELMQGSFILQSAEKFVPCVDFMQKIHSEAVAAYYSHPLVWSEIGYAGPAYPRGYVRSELGLTDPWEAKQNDK